MVAHRNISKTQVLLAWLMAVSVFLTACATRPVAPVSAVESLAGAVTVPYRLSSSGRFLVDVSINGGPARPMSVDTGATVSVIYGDFAKGADLMVSDRTRFVRGLVAQGNRPVIEGVSFQIGAQSFPLNQVVMLDTPAIQDEAVGLLGGDILRGQTVVFNRAQLRATFIPAAAVDPRAFAGWRRIPLQRLKDETADAALFFAETHLNGTSVPVLIDTGSNLTFINWKLATMDKDIRRLEREMVRNGTLQGALDSTSVILETVFYDLKLGAYQWDEIPVVVAGLDGLSAIAPTDEPMMVAGANLFAAQTIGLDLEGLSLYIYPDVYPGANR